MQQQQQTPAQSTESSSQTETGFQGQEQGRGLRAGRGNSAGNGARLEQLGIKGAGEPLKNRAKLEATFGMDLSDVRMHTGPEAKDACEKSGARGLSVGNHILVAEGNDDRLIAHEVAHVVQTRGGTQAGTGASGNAEQQADAAATAAASGQAAPVQGKAEAGIHRDELPEAASSAIRDARDSVGRQWGEIFANMETAIDNFAQNASIPAIPDSPGRAAWDYAAGEMLDAAKDAAGPLGTIVGYVGGLYTAVSGAEKNLETWRDTVALTDYAVKMRRAVARMRTSSSTYYNGDGSAGHQRLVQRYQARPEADRAQWLLSLRDHAQRFNLADVNAEYFEGKLATGWINENFDPHGTGTGHDWHRTGVVRLTYKLWQDRTSDRVSLDSANLDVPGGTGIIHEMQDVAGEVRNVSELPVRKEIWLREWDEEWIDEEVAAAWSMYGPDNSLEQAGTFGDALQGRLGREYADSSLRNLPIAWSQIEAG